MADLISRCPIQGALATENASRAATCQTGLFRLHTELKHLKGEDNVVIRIAIALLTSAFLAPFVPMSAAHAQNYDVACMKKCAANESQCRAKFLKLYGPAYVKQRCVDIARHNCNARCVVK